MCRNYKCSVVRFILISVIILAGFTSPVYAKIKSSAAYDETNTGKVTQYSTTASGSAVREIKSNGDNEYEVTEDGTPLAGFDANKADIVFNQVSITEDRKKKYDYTLPYTVAYAALVTRKDNDDIKNFADLKGKKSAHSATSNWAGIAQKYGAQIVTVDGFSKGIELIIAKRADATINDTVTFYDYIAQRPNAPLKIAAKGSEPIYSAALVKKDNEELVNAVNKAIDELSKEGKLSEISVKYFGKDITK